MEVTGHPGSVRGEVQTSDPLPLDVRVQKGTCAWIARVAGVGVRLAPQLTLLCSYAPGEPLESRLARGRASPSHLSGRGWKSETVRIRRAQQLSGEKDMCGAGGRGERGLAGKWKMLSITAASEAEGLKSDLTQEFLPLEK